MRPATLIITAGLMLSGCATTPTGPVASNVMPAHGKSLASFADDDVLCRHFAAGQVEGAAAHNNLMQAVIAGGGTLLGAGIGAVAGGGRGAAIGAGAGALGGTAVGGIKSESDQTTLQQRYDLSYAQCQKTKGNHVEALR